MRLIQFYADWCQPCKMMKPIIDEIEKDMPDLEVYRVNIDEDRDTTQAFDVRGVPTFILIDELERQTRAVGAMPKDRLIDQLGLSNT